MQQLALPATLIQVEHRPGALEEPRVAREHPRAMLPRLDRVLGQPPRDRGRRRVGDATLDHQPMKLSPGEPGDRHAKLARQLARDRLDLRHLLRGKNDAGDPHAAYPAAPPVDPNGTVFAISRRPPASYPAAPRSPRSSGPAPHTARSAPAGPSETVPSTGQRSPQVRSALAQTARSHQSSGGPCPQIRRRRHNPFPEFHDELTTATTKQRSMFDRSSLTRESRVLLCKPDLGDRNDQERAPRRWG